MCDEHEYKDTIIVHLFPCLANINQMQCKQQTKTKHFTHICDALLTMTMDCNGCTVTDSFCKFCRKSIMTRVTYKKTHWNRYNLKKKTADHQNERGMQSFVSISVPLFSNCVQCLLLHRIECGRVCNVQYACISIEVRQRQQERLNWIDWIIWWKLKIIMTIKTVTITNEKKIWYVDLMHKPQAVVVSKEWNVIESHLMLFNWCNNLSIRVIARNIFNFCSIWMGWDYHN